MNQRERNALDRYITGNWGEDSVPNEEEYTEPIYPQDFDEDQFIAEQQAVANEMYQASLRERGITEEEHLVEVMGWCDRQD